MINRGNYRQDLFINDGAHEAFERCLFEACEKCGWVLEGFLRDDESFSSGSTHAKWKLGVWNEVVTGDFREPLPPFSKSPGQAVPGAIQESDRRGG